MNKASYAEYLKSPHWIAFKKRFFKRSQRVHRMRQAYGGIVCEFCSKEGEFHLHHRNYDRIGKERTTDVIILCINCHKAVHQEENFAPTLKAATNRIRKQMKIQKQMIVLGLIALIFTGCAGINRFSASRMTTPQLILRLSQTNRELYALRSEHDNAMVESERDAIERELLERCEAGDHQACSTTFRVDYAPTWRWNAMSYAQRREYQP